VVLLLWLSVTDSCITWSEQHVPLQAGKAQENVPCTNVEGEVSVRPATARQHADNLSHGTPTDRPCTATGRTDSRGATHLPPRPSSADGYGRRSSSGRWDLVLERSSIPQQETCITDDVCVLVLTGTMVDILIHDVEVQGLSKRK
jgi:hypothetical protein